MKKLFFTICALCLCGTMWGQDAVQDESTGLWYQSETINFSNTNYDVVAIVAPEEGSYSLQNLIYVEDGDYYTLPETLGGQTITCVDTNAFKEALIDTTNPIHLVIPANINYLGKNCFQACTQIEEVTLEYSESQIGEINNALYGCSFYGCSNIKTVNMNREVGIARGDSDSNHIYRISPFSDLTSIETIYIGEHVTSIPYNMFNCNNTTSCSLQTVYCYATSMIPTLGYYAFGAHTDLTLYVYNELVTSFQEDSQTYSWSSFCSNIVGMGDMPTTLEDGTYKDIDTGLYFEVNEETGVVSIYHDEAGIYTDANLVAHSTITGAYTLPEKVSADGETYYDVTRIEASAFEGSSISGHIVIPAHITAMGEAAFMNCTGITEVTYEYSSTPIQDEKSDNNSTQTQSFAGCSNIVTVNLYRDITIGHSGYLCGPFVWQSSITTINIGPRVTEIPDYLFRNTSNHPIKNINIYSVEPPTFSTTYHPFDRLDDFTLSVPFGTSELYKESVWSTYINSSDASTDTGNCTLAELTNAFAITTHDNNEGTAYATFYNGASDVELFDGELTAYVAYQLDQEDDGLYIEIESIGNTVPSGTGVIVETEAEGTYLAIATGEKTDFTETNDLYGYDEAIEISNPSGSYYYYLLSSNDGQVGFYWGAEDGGAFECQAHRAYLALPQDAVDESNGISIRKGNGGEDTTGISSVESATEGATVKGIYTIQGVRVSNMNQPGLYIVDGKKVLVK